MSDSTVMEEGNVELGCGTPDTLVILQLWTFDT